MKWITTIESTTCSEGMERTVRAHLYDDRIVWDYAEHLQFSDDETDRVEQTYDAYFREGPPEFAVNYAAEKFPAIDRVIREGGLGLPV